MFFIHSFSSFCTLVNTNIFAKVQTCISCQVPQKKTSTQLCMSVPPSIYTVYPFFRKKEKKKVIKSERKTENFNILTASNVTGIWQEQINSESLCHSLQPFSNANGHSGVVCPMPTRKEYVQYEKLTAVVHKLRYEKTLTLGSRVLLESVLPQLPIPPVILCITTLTYTQPPLVFSHIIYIKRSKHYTCN